MRNSAPIFALVFTLLPSLGRAQTGDASTRRELIQRAQEAAAAGRHADALDLALRAGQIETSTSLRAFLINEQRATGHFAAALDNAEQCFREATTNTSLPDRASILAACSAASSALATQVSHITVRAPTPAPDGLRITVGTATLRSAVWGIPYVVDAGDVLVRAEAPGFRPFEQTVRVGASASSEVVVVLRASPGTVADTRAQSPTTHQAGSAIAGPIVVGVAGLVAIGVAVGLGVATQGSYSSFEHIYCTRPANTECQATQAAMNANGSAAGLEAATYVTWAVGGAAVAVGTVWLIAAVAGHHNEDAMRRTRVFVPSPLAGGMPGITVGGVF